VAQIDTVERTFQYDFPNWLVGDVNFEQRCSATPGDAKCRRQTLFYNAMGDVVSATSGDTTDKSTLLAAFNKYDSWGNVIETRFEDGFGDQRVVCRSFETFGVFPFATVNSLGHTTYAAFRRRAGLRPDPST
jgi:hypothetical protein